MPAGTLVPLIGGILLALGLAFLLSRMDALQKRQVLPGQQIQIVDLEATISAGEVTLVNISGDVGIELITPLPGETRGPQGTPAGTPLPVFLPTCAAAPPGWTLITVSEGDTLAVLSLRFGVTITELRRANCLNEVEEIVPGQRLFVDQGDIAMTPQPSATANCVPPAGWTAYTFAANDSLPALALARNTTVSLIERINCLEDELLLPGRVIYLPSLSPPSSTPPPTAVTRPALPKRATAAPTPANTSRPVPIITVTASPTRLVATATRLSTSTPTPLPAPDNAPTHTPSALPPASATPTATPRTEPAPPATATLTPSPLPSATATKTIVPSATPSPTATATPTVTATLPPPATATSPPAYPPQPPTFTPTPTQTPTATPTATPTPLPYPYP